MFFINITIIILSKPVYVSKTHTASVADTLEIYKDATTLTIDLVCLVTRRVHPYHSWPSVVNRGRVLVEGAPWNHDGQARVRTGQNGADASGPSQ